MRHQSHDSEIINNLDDLYVYTKEKLQDKSGVITIHFADRPHTYTKNDVVGNCLQEWLPEWFQHIGVTLTPTEETQKFPDFVAHFEGGSYDVEVKAWNVNASPAFDIANFYSFIDTTYEHPEKLNAVYFILGYEPRREDDLERGFVVRNVYMKRIWQITGPKHKHGISLQVKRGQPYALRPIGFHRHPENAFTDPVAFICAVHNAYKQFYSAEVKTICTPDEWKSCLLKYAQNNLM